MKLLIVGSDYTWSIERHYLKYIKEQNPDTLLFPAQNRLFDYLGRSVFNKVKHRIGFTGIYNRINQELWKTIEEFKPDCIWVFKGMQVLPETLRRAKQKGIKLVNYNPDNPFIFTGRGSGNTFVTQSLPLYDLHFTYNLEVQKQLEVTTGKPIEFLPFGYDLSQVNIAEIMQEQEIVKPCFLGNPDPDRATFIKALNRQGIHLDIFGNNWHTFVSPVKNTIYPAVYGIDFYKVLRRYRVQLNIMRIHNLQSHNMRSFEIPAVGGIQLAPDTPEHRMFFEPDKEIFLYQTPNECIRIIHSLLYKSKDSIKDLRISAQNKCTVNGYSYQQRAMQVFTKLKQTL